MVKILSLAAVLLSALLSALPVAAETVAFQSRQNNKYIAVDASGVLAARSAAPQAQLFEMIRLEGDRVAFRDPASGRFLRAGVTASTYLAFGERHIRGWETFQMRQVGPDITRRSVQNGKFVRAGVGAETRLAAVSDLARSWETFRLVPAAQLGSVSTGPAPERGARATRVAAPTDLRFAGRWRLRELFNTNGAPVSLENAYGRDARVTISRSGEISGTAGCNTFSGQIMEITRNGAADATRYRVDQLMTTKMNCGGPIGLFERTLYYAVDGLHVVGQSGRSLRFSDKQARRLVTLRRE